MKKLIRTLSIFFLLVGFLPMLAVGQFKVVGYQAYWSGSAGSIQYSKLTHINYSFALPQWDGHLKPLNNPGFLQQIVSNAHAVGTKVYIAIGGWSDNGTVIGPTFESLASSASGRSNLVNDAMALVHTYNLDGVDIDWEFPNPGASANNFAALMQQLASSLHAEGKGLSAAVNATSYYGNNILSSTFSYIDHFNIMAYDNTSEPNHSSYSFAQSTLNYWVSQRGLPKSKAILGVPFYARPSWNAYNTLVAQGANPYSDQFGSDYYNGITTIQNKTQLAYNSGGGIMIWELSQDASGGNSLLSAIDTKRKSLGGGSNQNPSVSISSPGNGASFTAPASIIINANASDPDGSISKVEFYNGSSLLGSDNSSPFSFTWNNVAAGSYSIKAKAYDNSTGSATSSVVNISVIGSSTNKAPSVSITSPTNGASYSSPATITINANASDSDGNVTLVEFYNGSSYLGSDYSAPYSFAWSNVGAGTYAITAKAYDNSNASTTSASVSVTVTGGTTGGTCTAPAWNPSTAYNGSATVSYNNHTYLAKWWTQGEQPDLNTGDGKPWSDQGACNGVVTSNKLPSVSITSPSSGANYTAPASINITASASDADGSITKVEFYNGSSLLGTSNSSPYSYSWINVAGGSYSISAKAYDNAGGVSTSSAITVSVSGTSTGGNCASTPQYSQNGNYVAGSKVQNVGSLYECKPWPYSGWCNGVASAYAPGTGTNWQDAWTLVGSCSAKMNATSSAISANEGVSPNPAANVSEINVKVQAFMDANETMSIVSSTGTIMQHESIQLTEGENEISVNVTNLNQGIYLIKIGEKTFRFVKQ